MSGVLVAELIFLQKIMKKRNRKKERIYAWLGVLAFLALLTAVLFTIIYITKDALVEKVNELFPEESVEVVEEDSISEEEIDTTIIEEALSEEAIEEIFNDVEEEPEDELDEQDTISENEALDSQIEDIISQMTLEQKIGQMLFVTPESITGVDVATVAGEKTKQSIEKYPIGGIILFKQNVETEEQLTEMTANLQKYSKEITGLPMFIGIDEEGGKLVRIAGKEGFDAPAVDDMRSIGETNDIERAREAGDTIGGYLNRYGFNIDFAPDSDVITESENKVIGNRSFGTDPQLVSDMSRAYLDGLHNNNILGCAKHYPGHGSTKEDSHNGEAICERSWDELKEQDLVPFIDMINDGIKVIMVSHISVPEVTGDNIPSSMSGILLTEKLRLEFGYQGIIITDAMNMGAISEKYSSQEAIVESIKAGVDIILMPSDIDGAFESILEAINNNEISEERINDSVRKIVKTKLAIEDNEQEVEE